MRFLCLHGMGTNNHIFEQQTATLRYELGDGHSYDFVEGTIPWTVAPELVGFANERCYSYIDVDNIDSNRKALSDINDYLESDGPFDGVIAFSQGAALASTLILQKLLKNPLCEESSPTFKCAIFLSGIVPCDPRALEHGELSLLDVNKIGAEIAIPTAHIWGSKEDQNLPTTLRDIYKGGLRESFVHGGGHEIPGLSNKAAMIQTVHIIRRTIAKAQSLYQIK